MSKAVKTRLVEDWRRCGVEPGCMTLIHSSLRRTLARLGEQGDVQLILDSLIEAAGSGGTMLFPLFNFDFTKGVTFDIRRTPSRMGALTEAARLRPGAVRTGHPIYSFAALGAEAHRFEGLINKSGYGPDSPFAILRRAGGRIAVLDLPDQRSMTFYHHVEEMLEAPWRYHKRFEADWVGFDGAARRRAFSLSVRDLEKGVKTRVDPMGERLWARGIWTGERPGVGAGLRTADADAVFKATAEAIEGGEGEALLYEIAP